LAVVRQGGNLSDQPRLRRGAPRVLRSCLNKLANDREQIERVKRNLDMHRAEFEAYMAAVEGRDDIAPLGEAGETLAEVIAELGDMIQRLGQARQAELNSGVWDPDLL
jgi:uncharacterized alpha-E superfamily protein